MFANFKLTKFNSIAILSSLFVFYTWILFCLYIIFILKDNNYYEEFNIAHFDWLTITFSLIFLILIKVTARSDGYIYSIQSKNNILKKVINIDIIFIIFNFITSLFIIMKANFFIELFFIAFTTFIYVTMVCKIKIDTFKSSIISIVFILFSTLQVLFFIMYILYTILCLYDFNRCDSNYFMESLISLMTCVLFILYLSKSLLYFIKLFIKKDLTESNTSVSFKIKISNKVKIMVRFILRIIFMEYFAADQSKNSNENAIILKKIMKYQIMVYYLKKVY